jgi:hypothetical protein
LRGPADQVIRLAGLPFEVVPPDRLSPPEKRSLARFPPGDAPPIAPAVAETIVRPFVLELVDAAPESAVPAQAPNPAGSASGEPADDAPAVVDWDGAQVTIRHLRLAADLDPRARRGRLRRDASVGWPLEVTLRTALTAVLPLEGGLPLHAAGVVMGGRGVVFFGPSGAGKSTLAASTPRAVLSDEMVAVVPGVAGYVVGGTGFWGTYEAGGGPDAFPVAAVVELDRGPGTRVDALDSRTALRRLIAATLVPPGPPFWSAALGVMADLVARVPSLRLAWSPHEPWIAIEEALRSKLFPASGPPLLG